MVVIDAYGDSTQAGSHAFLLVIKFLLGHRFTMVIHMTDAMQYLCHIYGLWIWFAVL